MSAPLFPMVLVTVLVVGPLLPLWLLPCLVVAAMTLLAATALVNLMPHNPYLAYS